MSAPTQKTNGLPVKTAASQSPLSSSSRTLTADSKAERPSVVGFRWSSPLSIVTIAMRPAALSLKTVSANAFPEDRATHAHADAERRQPVAAAALAQAVGELRDQPDAGGGERMPEGDRAAVRIEARVVGGDAELVAPRQHLHRKRLVQLEEVDLAEGHARLLEHALRRGNWADPHQMWGNACIRIVDEPELRLHAELLHGVLRRRDRSGRAVGQPGVVAGGDAAARAQGGPQ